MARLIKRRVRSSTDGGVGRRRGYRGHGGSQGARRGKRCKGTQEAVQTRAAEMPMCSL